jgi:hypothetical protein
MPLMSKKLKQFFVLPTMAFLLFFFLTLNRQLCNFCTEKTMCASDIKHEFHWASTLSICQLGTKKKTDNLQPTYYIASHRLSSQARWNTGPFRRVCCKLCLNQHLNVRHLPSEVPCLTRWRLFLCFCTCVCVHACVSEWERNVFC